MQPPHWFQRITTSVVSLPRAVWPFRLVSMGHHVMQGHSLWNDSAHYILLSTVCLGLQSPRLYTRVTNKTAVYPLASIRTGAVSRQVNSIRRCLSPSKTMQGIKEEKLVAITAATENESFLFLHEQCLLRGSYLQWCVQCVAEDLELWICMPFRRFSRGNTRCLQKGIAPDDII